MRVAVTRTGGFAGVRRSAVLDTAGRPDTAEWDALAAAALAAFPDVPGPPAPDRFTYRVQIGGQRAEVAEAQLAGALRELVRRVLAEGTPEHPPR